MKPSLNFEIGTEEGIRKYNTEEFETMIKTLWTELPRDVVKKIKYLVVQGGTRVREGKNIGISEGVPPPKKIVFTFL